MKMPILLDLKGDIEAFNFAIRLSKIWDDKFFYLYRCTAGGYLIDWINIDSDNQKHLKTFKNGNITL